MSVRRRNVQARLGRDLQFERGNHDVTRGLLKVTQEGFRRALEERDEARRQRDALRERLLALAEELARYFTEPPALLSRESDLFRMVQEIASGSIPVIPNDVLQTVLGMSGVTMEDVLNCARESVAEDTSK